MRSRCTRKTEGLRSSPDDAWARGCGGCRRHGCRTGADSDDQSRQIVAEEFVSKRPAGARKTAAKARYKPAKGSKAVVGGEARLGLTIWRLRPATGQPDGARLLVQEGGAESAWVAERVDADTPLDVGDRVRLSFESARAGFLYVIDREQYADGTASEPYLIFPTSRTRGGDNRVEAGPA